jgi:hypothetical protein
VFAAASHGLFIGAAAKVLADPALDKVLVTDSVPPFRLPPALLQSRVEVLDSTPLFAEAIRRLHSGGSLVELLEANPSPFMRCGVFLRTCCRPTSRRPSASTISTSTSRCSTNSIHW